MESKWIDLAATTAVVERVDLFLQTREFRLRLSASDLCPHCFRRMPFKAVEATAELEESAFQCRNCAPSIGDAFALMPPELIWQYRRQTTTAP
jgi:hypothetical protein